jgi:hypothetical protein
MKARRLLTIGFSSCFKNGNEAENWEETLCTAKAQMLPNELDLLDTVNLQGT